MPFQRLLQWVSMATAAVCTLWFYPATLDPFNIPKLAVLVVGAAALIGLLAGQYKQWWSRQEAVLVGTVTLFIVGLGAAGLASQQNAYRTLWGAWARNDGFFAYTSLAIVALAVAVAFRGAQARFAMYALVAVGACEVVYSTVQTFGADPVQWNNGYNAIIGTVGNPNFASALLGIAAVGMCWLAAEPSHPVVVRIAGAIFGLAAVWLTLRSDSIQGTLAFGAGFAMLLAGWLFMDERSASLRSLAWPYVGVLGFSAVVGVLGLAGNGPLGSVLYSQNLVNRTYYWRAGWKMFLDHPLVGTGLDSFGDWYRIYRLPEQVAATGVDTTTNAAHSIVFQMLATGGLAFFGTYLLLQILVVWRAAIALRSGENRLLVSGAFGAWIAFLLQSLFSIDQLGLTVWGWVLSGLVIGASYAPATTVATKSGKRRAAQQQPSGVGTGVVAAVVLALGAVVLVGGPLSNDAKARELMSYSVDKTQTAQVTAVTNLVLGAVDGMQDPYWRTQAVAKLYEIGAVDSGITLAESSVQLFPRDVQLWNLIAIAYEQTGRAALAIPARSKTIELDPLNSGYRDLLAQDKAAK